MFHHCIAGMGVRVPEMTPPTKRVHMILDRVQELKRLREEFAEANETSPQQAKEIQELIHVIEAREEEEEHSNEASAAKE